MSAVHAPVIPRNDKFLHIFLFKNSKSAFPVKSDVILKFVPI